MSGRGTPGERALNHARRTPSVPARLLEDLPVALDRPGGDVPFLAPPTSAAWQHREARTGFEVVHFRVFDAGHRITGSTTAVEAGAAWAVAYEIDVDAAWRTRRARVHGRSASGERTLEVLTDGQGRWRVDGWPAPHLTGCMDVDLESSAMTNALPVHRLALAVGQPAAAPAAYVRAPGLAVERLEQEYVRAADDGARQRYRYSAPRFDVSCELTYDDAGLVLAYPGLAARVA